MADSEETRKKETIEQALNNWHGAASIKTIQAIAGSAFDDGWQARSAEIAALTARVEAAENADKIRLEVLHKKFGYVQDPSTAERKCACAYCRRDFEAIAEHAAELECELHLPGGFKDRAQTAEKKLAEAEREKAELRWIPVEESLPPYGEYVLVFVTDDMEGNKNFVQDNCRERTLESEAAWTDGTITHWMPLPKPPRILSPREGGKKGRWKFVPRKEK